MHHLPRAEIGEIVDRFGCRYFTETGGRAGAGIDEALAAGVRQVYSIERDHALAIVTAFRHTTNRGVTIIHARPDKGLAEVLPEIPAEAPALFHLNAVLKPAEAVESQLRQIAAARDVVRDVIVIDAARDPGFVEAVLGRAHRLERRAGALCAYPLGGHS